MRTHPKWPRYACTAFLALLPLASGCADPQARYDAFLDRTSDMRGGDAGQVMPGERFDFSGSYLAALAINIDPSNPVLFACEVAVASDLTTLDLTFQPLSTDQDSDPRAPVGESFGASDIPYSSEGTFQAEFEGAMVPARANATGLDIVADVTINASAHRGDSGEPNFFCGPVSGMVRVPIMLDLAGSTMGAIAISDGPSGIEPLARCPSE